MHLRLAGLINIVDEIKIYTDDWTRFFYKNGNEFVQMRREKEITDEQRKNEKILTDLDEWAICLNSPWGTIPSISFNVSLTLIDPNSNQMYEKWTCVYESVGYDGISSSVYGYGNTEEEALKSCKDHFKYLQENYNKGGNSF